MILKSEPIAAISTPVGKGAISLIRVSGDNVLEIISKIFKFKNPKISISNLKSRFAYFGYIVEYPTGKKIDEGILIYYKAPKSYTGEDMFELTCHGGVYITRKVLENIIRSGARQAKPGEFTLRAVLNGKMDITQAIAVNEIVEAQNEISLKVSLNKLEGKLREWLKNVKETVLELLKEIEARIDFPEDVSEDIDLKFIESKITSLIREVENIIKKSEKIAPFYRGASIVIAGKPNVGKSTLFNALIGEERAIVTPIPGTTRDVLKEEITLEGFPLKIFDTAGLRKSADVVEEIGIKKAKEVIHSSDIVLFVLDASQGISEEEIEFWKSIEGYKLCVLNKVDLKDISLPNIFKPFVKISAKEKLGIEKIFDFINEHLRKFSNIDIYLGDFEKNNLISALEEIRKISVFDMPFDLIAFHLKEFVRKINHLIDIKDLSEEVLGRIFESFCIGK